MSDDAWDAGYDAGVRECQHEIDKLRAELYSALAEVNRLLLAVAQAERRVRELEKQREVGR